ncbi:ATPase domain-containing protein [Sporichthya polymorpha]|uniref:ATPase domain-containing protein n=1 Tax=Sporichthya polymorpha TaxID=35751 RepID=UPI00039DD4C2|nr:ATPase domain-containing protein [Sporichthya polymorpha]
MSARLSSGHPRLDQVLGGGIWNDALTMITGDPGTGKTLLAQQIVFANATPERPSLYVSTVSEPMEKILRYGRSLSFFDEDAIGKYAFYEDLGGVLDERGLPAFVERLEAVIAQHRPALIVIDSFKALHAFAQEPSDFRWFLHDIAARLSATGAAALWVGEYNAEEISREPEFAVADAIISLTSSMTSERQMRMLQVMKLRGSDFMSGQHGYRLSADGLHVFPRLADVPDRAEYEVSAERLTSGISVLDSMTGGYWPGSSTLAAGPSGVGKTVLGLSFIVAGADAGERGLIATLQENPTQLARAASGFGWDLSHPQIEVLYRSSVDLYVDEWVHTVLDTVERTGVSRLMVDSLGDLAHASPDPIRFREYVYSFVQRCATRGVSVFLTMEVPDLFHLNRLSELGVSNMSDNVILLQYVRAESKIKRAVTVLKTRASAHEPEVRRYRITHRGIEVGGPMEAYET